MHLQPLETRITVAVRANVHYTALHNACRTNIALSPSLHSYSCKGQHHAVMIKHLAGGVSIPNRPVAKQLFTSDKTIMELLICVWQHHYWNHSD